MPYSALPENRKQIDLIFVLYRYIVLLSLIKNYFLICNTRLMVNGKTSIAIQFKNSCKMSNKVKKLNSALGTFGLGRFNIFEGAC